MVRVHSGLPLKMAPISYEHKKRDFGTQGMTVIPVFSIRTLLTPPRTFICARILPRSLLARLTECR